MDFCAGGLNISGPPITKTYVQPTGGDALYIEAIFVDDEGACFPGETVNWDEDRCKFILNRPIFECEPDSNPQTQIAKYGKQHTLSPQYLLKTFLKTKYRRENRRRLH